MSIIRKIKKLFGIYETGHEYWVDRKDIKVDPEWRKTLIGRKKWKRKRDFYFRHGKFESYIVLRRKDWMLVDGYSSFRLAEVYGIDRVPVYFI